MSEILDAKMTINISWWNVNKRFYLFSQNPEKIMKSIFDGDHDMIFISETNLGFEALPSFADYAVIADPHRKLCHYGGIAWYVKNTLARHIFQTQFNESYISFRLDIAPKYIFIGVYIQPEGARSFDVSMFADVGAMLSDCREKGLTPFIGGDFNTGIQGFFRWN